MVAVSRVRHLLAGTESRASGETAGCMTTRWKSGETFAVAVKDGWSGLRLAFKEDKND